MSFHHPQLLWLLGLPLLLALLAVRARRLAQIAAGRLAAARWRWLLVEGAAAGRGSLALGLQLLGLALMFVALAQPRWGQQREVQQESGRNVLLVVDTSRSMLANDVVPDRLSRVRMAALDLLSRLKGDRIGLIAFAGNAYLQAPLTTDHEAIAEAIESLDFTSVPTGGSELANALSLAHDTLQANAARNHGVVVFSDGGEAEADIAAQAQKLAKMQAMVLAVGVGTEQGSLIPDPDPDRRGDFVRDHEGKVVKTVLQPAVLQEVAKVTGGQYFKLSAQGLADSLVGDLFARLQAQTHAAREVFKPIERFQWPLAVAVLLWLAALSLRPSVVASALRPAGAPILVASLLLFGVAVQPSGASLANWFQTRNSPAELEALEAQERGEHELALKHWRQMAENHGGRGLEQAAMGEALSARALQDYDRAIEGFSRALESESSQTQLRAHQGLAHSLYDLGDRAMARQPKLARSAWRESLRHFDTVLETDPNNKAVVENREFVAKRLEELEEQMQQQGQQGKKGQQGQKGERGQEGEEGEDGESGDGESQEDRSRKESLGKKEGEDEGKGEGDQEGQLRAGQQGQEESPEARARREEREARQREEARNGKTGFSRNEARSFLRTYADDQKKALQLRPRNDAVRGKDW
jgi:Ca-activated chloride channel family protein